ncbi:MAG: YkgJ family cysteine cluster protein [Planctomycetaceae bacterium]
MFPQLDVLEPASCDGCGLCCEGIGSPVLLYQSLPGCDGPHPHRPPGLPQSLIDEIDEHFLGLPRGQEPQVCCLWYDPAAKRCRHYDWRPAICRDYELGGDACLRRRGPFVG